MLQVTAPPDLIDTIRLEYRRAKTTEDTRNRLMAGVVSFIRVNISGWHPGATPAERKRTAASAMRVVKRALIDARPSDAKGQPVCSLPGVLTGLAEPQPGDKEIRDTAEGLIAGMCPVWWLFELTHATAHRRTIDRLAELPAFPHLSDLVQSTPGFSPWGLVAIIGEAGDLGHYSGVRKLYKRLGLAPDDCYPRGEKKTGRKIPRAARGRIMGIIADPLLRAQWRGPKEDEAAGHPIGAYGAVYGEAKARQLAADKTKSHADKLARRAMVKALLHDVHRAWHGLPPDYTFSSERASHGEGDSRSRPDRSPDDPSTEERESQWVVDSHRSCDLPSSTLTGASPP